MAIILPHAHDFISNYNHIPIFDQFEFITQKNQEKFPKVLIYNPLKIPCTHIIYRQHFNLKSEFFIEILLMTTD